MPIFEESRYESSDVVPVQDGDGAYHATVIPGRVVLPPRKYRQYLTRAGDRLERLAGSFYQDPEKWWVIADANPSLPYPDDLVPGTLIKIPLTVIS